MTVRMKDGQYYYAPLRRRWGVWRHHELGNGMFHGVFIKDFDTKEEAERDVYARNGWEHK